MTKPVEVGFVCILPLAILPNLFKVIMCLITLHCLLQTLGANHSVF